MAKFYGAIGYATQTETAPGVSQEVIIERTYRGDLLKDTTKTRDGEFLNDKLILENRISIVADPYAYENFQSMRYVAYLGIKWKIASIDVQRPRLVLMLGGVYNKQTT